jgi:hypothetical protein
MERITEAWPGLASLDPIGEVQLMLELDELSYQENVSVCKKVAGLYPL